jgi:hypothetical protein
MAPMTGGVTTADTDGGAGFVRSRLRSGIQDQGGANEGVSGGDRSQAADPAHSGSLRLAFLAES